jgi:hypothetical protein
MPRRRTGLIVAAIVVGVLIVVGGTTALVLVGTDDEPNAKPTPSISLATAATITPGLPIGSSGSITEAVARETVVDYLNAVNDKDKVAAGDLICESHYAAWKKNADSADSDFNFTVSRAEFLGSDPDSSTGGRIAHYSVTFDDGTSNKVEFTVIDESGPKLCGIGKP